MKNFFDPKLYVIDLVRGRMSMKRKRSDFIVQGLCCLNLGSLTLYTGCRSGTMPRKSAGRPKTQPSNLNVIMNRPLFFHY